MNNKANDKLDSMLRNYYGREQESFRFTETPKKRIYLRYSSAIAAVLAIIICAGLLIYTCIEPKNNFVISVAAQGSDEYTNLSVKTFYKATFDLNYAGVTERSEMLTAGIISVSGKTVKDVEAKSLKGDGEFLKATDDGFYFLDSDGNLSMPKDDSQIVLICSDEEFTEKEKTSSVWYVPVDENGNHISNNEHIDEKKTDTVAITIHFEDGTNNTCYIHISYIQGKMHLKYVR